MQPSLGGEHHVHRFEHCAHAPVAALHQFGHIAVAETEMQTGVPQIASQQQGTCELLFAQGWEMTPKITVFEAKPFPLRRARKAGHTHHVGRNAVVARILHPDTERIGGADLPVEHEGGTANGACGIVEVV